MPAGQLQMLWAEARLTSPPEVAAPEGYTVRVFRPGDEAGHVAVMNAAGFDSWDEKQLKTSLRGVMPNGLFVAVHDATQEIVAAAMAIHNASDLHPFSGELGWVAGSPEHRGRGLGLAVCAPVVRRLIDAGFEHIFLNTDDWRLPAIKVYLKLGFVPFLCASDSDERWRTVCESLAWPFTPHEWPAVPFKHPDPDERPDDDRVGRYKPRHRWLPQRQHRGYSCNGDVDAFGDESLYKPSQLGAASASPDTVAAGGTGPLTLTYTAGPAGLPEGARVTFAMRGQAPLGLGRGPFALDGPGACQLEPAGSGFLVKGGSLKEGDMVTLAQDAAPWTPLAGRREFKVVIDYGGGEPERRLPEPVAINVLPRKLHRLEATLPCTRRGLGRLPLHITARDEFDNRALCNGPIDVRCADEAQTVRMIDGIARCAVASGNDDPARATVESAGSVAESNPSVGAGGLQLFVGDLHAHDFLSEAEGCPDQVYRWAIEDRNLDFLTVAPQSHGWHDNETWAICKYMNERFLKEGEFVTFLGYEWQHTGFGDKVIHFLGGDQPLMPVDDKQSCTPGRLYKLLRESDAFVVSHHPCYPAGSWRSSTDYDVLETDVERLIELWSMHGSSEGYDPNDRPLSKYDPERQVMSALRRGVRLGFVAGSDTHSARPGGSAHEPGAHWGGLAAVWAKDLTRRSVFEALRARRTYALMQARIVLKVSVNGAWMGSELPANDRAEIKIDVWAPGRIAKVEVLKNAQLLRTFGPFGTERSLELEDATCGPAFYHCRVAQEDGQLAVCSPVWIG